jgi:glycosyltransferase involved in cell wall biosynthesis
MYSPLVSVIIPTYNRKEVVKEAVQSVLEQDYPKIEVVIVDDGSHDGTTEELSRVFDSSVHYIFQKNSGKSRARNKGVIESQGELICFLDSDDILLPGSISARVQCFRDNENCQVSYGLFVKEKKCEKAGETLLKQEYPSGYILKECVNRLMFHNSSFMLSREDMLNHGMYREDLTNLEDYELFVRLTHKLYFCYCGTLCSLLRDKGQRARHSFEEIIVQGTKGADYIFADPIIAHVLADEKARLYAETYLRLAKASLKLNRPREFRKYFKMARETQHSQRWNFKFWRRWLLSLLRSL